MPNTRKKEQRKRNIIFSNTGTSKRHQTTILAQEDDEKELLEFVKKITDIRTLLSTLTEFKDDYYPKDSNITPTVIHQEIVQTLFEKLSDDMIKDLNDKQVITILNLLGYFFNKKLIKSTSENKQLLLKIGEAVVDNNANNKSLSSGLASYVLVLARSYYYGFLNKTNSDEIKNLVNKIIKPIISYFSHPIYNRNFNVYYQYLKGLSLLYSSIPGLALPDDNFFATLAQKITSAAMKMALVNFVRGIIASEKFFELDSSGREVVLKSAKEIVAVDYIIKETNISNDLIKSYIGSLGYLAASILGGVGLSDIELQNINVLVSNYKLDEFSARNLIIICNGLCQLHQMEVSVLLDDKVAKHLRNLVSQAVKKCSDGDKLKLVAAWSRVEKSDLCSNKVVLSDKIKMQCIDLIISNDKLESQTICRFLEVSSLALKSLSLTLEQREKLTKKLQSIMDKNIKNPLAMKFIFPAVKDLLISKLLDDRHLNSYSFQKGLDYLISDTSFVQYCQYLLRSIGYLHCQGIFFDDQLNFVIDNFFSMYVDFNTVTNEECLQIISGFSQLPTLYFQNVVQDYSIKAKLHSFINAVKIDELTSMKIVTLLDNLAKYRQASDQWKLKPIMTTLIGALEAKLRKIDPTMYKISLCAKLFSTLERLDSDKDSAQFKRLLKLTVETTLRFFDADLGTGAATVYNKADPSVDCKKLRKLCVQGSENGKEIVKLCQSLRSWTGPNPMKVLTDSSDHEKEEKTKPVIKNVGFVSLFEKTADSEKIVRKKTKKRKRKYETEKNQFCNDFLKNHPNINLTDNERRFVSQTFKKHAQTTEPNYQLLTILFEVYLVQKTKFYEDLQTDYPDLRLSDADKKFIEQEFKKYLETSQVDYEPLSIALKDCVTWQGPPILSSIFSCCGYYEFSSSQFTAPTLEAQQYIL